MFLTIERIEAFENNKIETQKPTPKNTQERSNVVLL